MNTTPNFALVRGLVRAVRAEQRSGRRPRAVVLGPDMAQGLKERAFAYLWSNREMTEILGVPVEIDPNATGWSLTTEA